MANMNAFTLTLDDGTRELPIVNLYGEEICRIHIRVGDISIIDRYEKFVKDMDDMIKPLSELNINSDGTSSITEDWATIKKVEADIIGKLNEVFGSHDIGKLFENRNAFSTINGVFYIEKVIEMLGDVVGKSINEEAQKASKRVSKYTKDIDGEVTNK